MHWVVCDLLSNTRELPEAVPTGEPTLQGGGSQGTNDYDNFGYGSPCPPDGIHHRYFFKLYALDAPLGLEVGATKQQLEEAMQGHILATAELIGRYERKV